MEASVGRLTSPSDSSTFLMLESCRDRHRAKPNPKPIPTSTPIVKFTTGFGDTGADGSVAELTRVTVTGAAPDVGVSNSSITLTS